MLSAPNITHSNTAGYIIKKQIRVDFNASGSILKSSQETIAALLKDGFEIQELTKDKLQEVFRVTLIKRPDILA